jgi:hypothetical protein
VFRSAAWKIANNSVASSLDVFQDLGQPRTQFTSHCGGKVATHDLRFSGAFSVTRLAARS